MDKPDPFGFDMRASSDKKKRARGRRGMSGAVETSKRECEHPGCHEAGQYRAPRNPDAIDDYLWFCKDHVREYNLKWNFFNGTTEEEFAAQVGRDRVWERDTKPMGRSSDEQRAWARLGVDDPHQVLGENATRNPGKGITQRKLPPTERRAIELLEAKDSWTKAEIRKQYKSLVKDLHPDMNGGNRADEERLQEVVWAWDQIKDSRSFRS